MRTPLLTNRSKRGLHMKRTTILLGLGCLATLGWTAPPDEPEETTLSHQTHRRWEFILPAERWHPVGDVILLPGGLEFETETEGPLKLQVDTDGDGRLDEDVRGQNIQFLTLRGEDDEGKSVRYTIRLKNVGKAKWEWATGSSMSGKVDGTRVHVFDQDGNGHFDDYGVDAIAIGRGNAASLLSEVLSIDGDLFHFEISPDGTTAKVSPWEGPTGTLDVHEEFEGRGKLVAAVFRQGDLSFEVAAERSGLKVPAGSYEFVSGRVERGSAHASIRTGRMRSVEVQEGETTELKWGDEIEAEFDYGRVGDELTVRADFAFFGAGGEEYYDFQPRSTGPKIVIAGTERGRELESGRFPES